MLIFAGCLKWIIIRYWIIFRNIEKLAPLIRFIMCGR